MTKKDIKRLALVTGQLAGLVEEVQALANVPDFPENNLYSIYRKGSWSAWGAKKTGFAWLLDQPDYGSIAKSAHHIDPIKFLEIEETLDRDGISDIYVVGAPKIRRRIIVWEGIRRLISQNSHNGEFRWGDKRFREHFNSNDLKEMVIGPARYFIALQRLLDERKIKVTPRFACELFPSLNPMIGDNTKHLAPDDVLNEIPEIVADLGKRLVKPNHRITRLAQAAIYQIHRIQSVERERFLLKEIEDAGTDEMIDNFLRGRPDPHGYYILVKLPSPRFNPALDQPTIGLTTIQKCQKARIKGIVVCAETTVVASKSKTIKSANDAGIFLYAINAKQLLRYWSPISDTSWLQKIPTFS